MARVMGVKPPGYFPFSHTPNYDNLELKGKLKNYREGSSAVNFDMFHGARDKLKALMFLQQFDTTLLKYPRFGGRQLFSKVMPYNSGPQHLCKIMHLRG